MDMNEKRKPFPPRQKLHSFIIDPFLLAGTALLIVFLADRFAGAVDSSGTRKRLTIILYIIAVCIFWLIAGGLYFDFLDMPFIGKYGEGNHFMWNSGMELTGMKPIVDTLIPTYADWKNPLNILGMGILLSYAFILFLMIKAVRSIKGRCAKKMIASRNNSLN